MVEDECENEEEESQRYSTSTNVSCNAKIEGQQESSDLLQQQQHQEQQQQRQKKRKNENQKQNKTKIKHNQQQHYQQYCRVFHKILLKWTDTDFEKYTTPILTSMDQHPVAALFIFIFGCLVFVPVVLTLFFMVSTLVLTICGSFVVFGTFSSIAFLGIGLVAFFASLVSIGLTAACLVGYNVSTGIQDFFTI